MALNRLTPQAVLLDIEGTTTPLSFVYETLFPYARLHGARFIREHWNDAVVVAARAELEDLNEIDQSMGAPVISTTSRESEIRTTINYYLWLMDQDRKVTPLKTLQGILWAEGFRRGQLKGEVFDDVPPALARWQASSRGVAIFSSGSVAAQQQLFQHTDHGDLSTFLSHYFDTRTGGKRESQSYSSITRALNFPAAEILFVSDVVAELDAAKKAGMTTALSLRPGNHEPPANHTHTVIQTFDQLP